MTQSAKINMLQKWELRMELRLVIDKNIVLRARVKELEKQNKILDDALFYYEKGFSDLVAVTAKQARQAAKDVRDE